jgi:hypothetical protein
MGWATFLAIFSQAHQVTLSRGHEKGEANYFWNWSQYDEINNSSQRSKNVQRILQ